MVARQIVNKNLGWQAVLFLIISSSAIADANTRFMHGLGDTRYKLIDSEAVGRSYHVFVRLPEGYDPSAKEKYPTVYLLDGGVTFPLLSAYYSYLRIGGELPGAIVVGISYGSRDLAGGNYRSTDYTAISAERDYWGGATQFQTFLSDELLPYIEREYQSDATRRIVFGQSLGGQFVLYTALTRPGLFWGHIASNPALHRNLAFFLQEQSGATLTESRTRLFVGSGSMDDPRYRGPALEWIEHWSGRDSKSWRLKTSILEGHSHFSAAPASFRQGMGWLFSSAAD
jgi:predicted alpha/beta superfamily hydrolase